MKRQRCLLHQDLKKQPKNHSEKQKQNLRISMKLKKQLQPAESAHETAAVIELGYTNIEVEILRN